MNQQTTNLLLSLFLSLLSLLPSSVAFISSYRPFHQHSAPSAFDIALQGASATSNSVDVDKGDVAGQDVLQRVFQDNDSRPVILFDGVCNMCNGGVNLALDWDPQGRFRFAALQSKVGRALLSAHGKEPDDISSIVLVTDKGSKAYFKSDAVLRIGQELTPLAGSSSLGCLLSKAPLRSVAYAGRRLVPKFVRDVIYDGVANNRYSILGKRDQCRFDADGEFDDRFVPDDNIL